MILMKYIQFLFVTNCNYVLSGHLSNQVMKTDDKGGNRLMMGNSFILAILTQEPTISEIKETNEPTKSPTPGPTPDPTPYPTEEPTDKPTPDPTINPTPEPSPERTIEPTKAPIAPLTKEPTEVPITPITEEPTVEPTKSPIMAILTEDPTKMPETLKPTEEPTKTPTPEPTSSPTKAETTELTNSPTESPISPEPTKTPTNEPTKSPTKSPTIATTSPTFVPTKKPKRTKKPTHEPTESPTHEPTKPPTNTPTITPTKLPTITPTSSPTTGTPSSSPTTHPSLSQNPTMIPSETPSFSPTTADAPRQMLEIPPFKISIATETGQIDNDALLQVTDIYLINMFQQKTDPNLNFRRIVLNYLTNPNRRLVQQSTFSMKGTAYFLTKDTLQNEMIYSIVEDAFTDYSDYYLDYLDSAGINAISVSFQWFSDSNGGNSKNNSVIAIAAITTSAALISLVTGIYLLRNRFNRRVKEETPKIHQKETSETCLNNDRIIDCPDTFTVVSELTYDHYESKSIITNSVYTLPTNDNSKLKIIDEKDDHKDNEKKDDYTTSNDTFDNIYDYEL